MGSSGRRAGGRGSSPEGGRGGRLGVDIRGGLERTEEGQRDPDLTRGHTQR